MDSTEYQSGGEFRTPRAEIKKILVRGKHKYEIRFFVDDSSSMNLGVNESRDSDKNFPHEESRRAVVLRVLPPLVKFLQGFDSELEREWRESGNYDKGGALTYFINYGPVGDLNDHNITEKLAKVHWGGGTQFMPVVNLADQKSEGEFEEDEEEHIPVDVFITDGEADDWEELENYFRRTIGPKHLAVVDIIGHGTTAKRTADAYKKVSDELQKADEFEHRRLHVVNHDGVVDSEEILGDFTTLLG